MSSHIGNAKTISVIEAALHRQEMRSKNYIAELNDWLRNSGWGIYLEEQEKKRKMDSTLMNCSWIGKQTMRDRKRTAKGELKRKGHRFATATKKKGMEDFQDGIRSIFFFNGDNV